jgi:RNA polymerase sigma factor (sigma-70 family)
MVELLKEYREDDKVKGIALIESAQIQGIIGREVSKYIPKFDQDEVIHQCELILLKLFEEIRITKDINDGRIVAYINKVLPLRLIDNLKPVQNNISLDAYIPGTDIPIVDTLESEEPSPEEVIIAEERNDQLRAAMLNLTPNQQCILKMYYFDEYTQQQIADHLEVSQPAVNRTIERALTSLKKHLVR